MVRDEALERLAREQRHVCGQDHDRPVAARGAGLPERVARAEPLALLDERDAVARGDAQVVGVGPGDHDRAVGERARGPQRVGDQRTAAERVEHFRLPGAHPLRFPGGENDGGQSAHGILTCPYPSTLRQALCHVPRPAATRLASCRDAPLWEMRVGRG